MLLPLKESRNTLNYHQKYVAFLEFVSNIIWKICFLVNTKTLVIDNCVFVIK